MGALTKDGLVLMTYRFATPSIAGERDISHPLWRRLRHDVGVAVLLIDGFYRQVQNPGTDDLASAAEVYLGGHEYHVSDAVAAALTTAGYGPFLTLDA